MARYLPAWKRSAWFCALLLATAPWCRAQVEPAGLDLAGADSTDLRVIESEDAASDEVKTEVIRERYPNRSVKVEREVTQDAGGNYINHGSWTMWDESGTKVAEGHFRMGERHGVWNRWYRGSETKLFKEMPYRQFTGPVVSQATFDNGQLHGKWAMYDSKQRKISEIEFNHGERHGTASWWYPNGRKMREITYRDGVIDGHVLEWSSEGALTTKDAYQDGRQLAAKTVLHKGRDAQKKSEGMYLHARVVVDKPDDWWTATPATYTTEGKDQKHGAWASWYENGQLQIQGEYRNDVPIGKFTWWYSNGQQALEGAYADGKPEGTWIWWYENGQKSTEGDYSAGNPTGRWNWWREDGIVAQAADFSPGHEGVADLPGNQHEALMLPEPDTQRE